MANDHDDSIDDMLDDLSEAAANDDVERLVRIIRDLHRRNGALETQLSDLRDEYEELYDRVGELEAVAAATEVDVGGPYFDRRDRDVLGVLLQQRPERVTSKDLQNLYKKHTDIRQKETLKERVKNLVKRGPFDKIDHAEWRYRGGSADDGSASSAT